MAHRGSVFSEQVIIINHIPARMLHSHPCRGGGGGGGGGDFKILSKV